MTGASGFVGGAVALHLLDAGWHVRGLDVRPQQWQRADARFEMIRNDLLTVDLDDALDGIDTIFHLAGQTGVRTSWANEFGRYLRNNVESTHRLLEAARHRPITRFVYASSSSVYGNTSRSVSGEDDATRPHSPYGVTKLAGELLCSSYAANFGVPTVSLRYFTVYGPGQRPDMSIHRMIRAALDQTVFHLFGDGRQSRDFTYVTDIVRATAAAAVADLPAGTVINVASGTPVTLRTLIRCVEDITGSAIRLESSQPHPGDVDHTRASLARARSLLHWRPEVRLREGVTAQVQWHLDHDDLARSTAAN